MRDPGMGAVSTATGSALRFEGAGDQVDNKVVPVLVVREGEWTSWRYLMLARLLTGLVNPKRVRMTTDPSMKCLGSSFTQRQIDLKAQEAAEAALTTLQLQDATVVSRCRVTCMIW